MLIILLKSLVFFSRYFAPHEVAQKTADLKLNA